MKIVETHLKFVKVCSNIYEIVSLFFQIRKLHWSSSMLPVALPIGVLPNVVAKQSEMLYTGCCKVLCCVIHVHVTATTTL